MAVKLIIHEMCTKCGKVAAQQFSDGSVYVCAHDCPDAPPGPPDYSRSRSFRPGEVIFVPASESNSVVELILANRELQAKNSQLSANFQEMASDCARLQKVLLDIGFKVRDILGIEIGSKISSRVVLAPTDLFGVTGSWQCTCDMWNVPSQKSCSNCGRSKQ